MFKCVVVVVESRLFGDSIQPSIQTSVTLAFYGTDPKKLTFLKDLTFEYPGSPKHSVGQEIPICDLLLKSLGFE